MLPPGYGFPPGASTGGPPLQPFGMPWIAAAASASAASASARGLGAPAPSLLPSAASPHAPAEAVMSVDSYLDFARQQYTTHYFHSLVAAGSCSSPDQALQVAAAAVQQLQTNGFFDSLRQSRTRAASSEPWQLMTALPVYLRLPPPHQQQQQRRLRAALPHDHCVVSGNSSIAEVLFSYVARMTSEFRGGLWIFESWNSKPVPSLADMQQYLGKPSLTPIANRRESGGLEHDKNSGPSSSCTESVGKMASRFLGKEAVLSGKGSGGVELPASFAGGKAGSKNRRGENRLAAEGEGRSVSMKKGGSRR
ncbi:sac3 ganp domain-containing protein [Cyclospora cayetanensis]|uniref:Sac3 ganp domain-containing protein n=1 Tax=Cyclospora cayetanensis TaxID=88456 RepID=A0A1D3CUH5_9EIME|nr:sac3 ganp domain-containing protein [Cyclospora cayetanensis]